MRCLIAVFGLEDSDAVVIAAHAHVMLVRAIVLAPAPELALGEGLLFPSAVDFVHPDCALAPTKVRVHFSALRENTFYHKRTHSIIREHILS